MSDSTTPTRRGPSRFSLVLLGLVVAAIGITVLASRAGAFPIVGHSNGATVTVTAPQPGAPVVTMPKIDDGTMAQLQVVRAGASFGSWAKVLVLTGLQMLIYVGLAVLVAGLALFKLHVTRAAGMAVMTTAGIGLGIALGLAVAISYVLPVLMGAAFGGLR